jgi:hypothetical protein
MVVVPTATNGQSHWTQRTALGGRDYTLTFDWRQRSGTWCLSLGDANGNLFFIGTLVVNWRLLQLVTDARRPPGELLLLDTTGAGQDPDFSGLGTRWQLTYLEPGELNA